MKRLWALELHKSEIKAELLYLITAILSIFFDLTLNIIICEYEENTYLSLHRFLVKMIVNERTCENILRLLKK